MSSPARSGSSAIPGSHADLPRRAEVVVIGGGIAGVSAFHHLSRAGIDVVLLERQVVGGGATSAAVGVLSPPVRQPFHETVRHRGADVASRIWRFALDSVAALGRTLEELGAAEEAELDLSGGWTLAEPHTEHPVRHSYEALATAGFPVRWVDAGEIRERLAGRGFTGGYFLEGGGVMAPGASARALAVGAVRAGGQLREGVAVQEVVRDEDGHVCVTERGEVRSPIVVYATHTDSRRFSTLLGDEIVPIRGQGLRARATVEKPFSGAFSTHWKFNVWRHTPDGELLMSGWRHDAWDRAYWKTRPELDPELQDDLESWFRNAFPGARLEEVQRWSGIFGWTADYLPLVGALPGSPSELVISGFSGGGLPFAFGCGRILADAVVGDEPDPAAQLLHPRRFV
jgi:glycine/D-amino acid oxidase-like deaminating enzyme